MSDAKQTLMTQTRIVTGAGNVKYKTRPAKLDEIKDLHPKCGTCLLRAKNTPDNVIVCGLDCRQKEREAYCNYYIPNERATL